MVLSGWCCGCSPCGWVSDVFVGVDGMDWELGGGVVVFDGLVVELDVLYDLFFCEVGVDGDGVWCVGGGFCWYFVL